MNKKRKFFKEITCPHCDGTGQEKDVDVDFEMYSEEPCSYCNGLGYLTDERQEVQGENLRIVEIIDTEDAMKRARELFRELPI